MKGRAGAGSGAARRTVPGCLSALAAAFLLLLAACTGKPPEIRRVFTQVNVVEDREQDITYESLSFFLQPYDPDGFEDLDELYLINDDRELFWKLDSESWQESGSGEERWIGSNGISMPDGRALPSGGYRVVLLDVGGDTVEDTVYLKPPSLDSARRLLPRAELQEGRIRLRGSGPFTLWLYDRAGRYLSAYQAPAAEITVDQLAAAQPRVREGFSFRVYTYHPDRGVGAVAGPYSWTP